MLVQCDDVCNFSHSSESAFQVADNKYHCCGNCLVVRKFVVALLCEMYCSSGFSAKDFLLYYVYIIFY